MVATDKTHLSLVVIGHVDAGKSTTVGHFLYEVGCVAQRTIDKLERESYEMGKPSFKFAWLTDRLREERERGISIDSSLTKFETASSVFTLVDAPGHRSFIKNSITGIAQADTALLVVSASAGEFETGFSLEAQTREHALLAFTFGIKQLIVAVNKMDDLTVAFSQERFEHVKNEVRAYLEQVGFETSAMPFVPISGWCGDNLVDKSASMPWYDGPTLLESLDILKSPRRAGDKPLRVTIQNSYKISGVGTVATGRVETGVLTPGTTVAFAPSGVSAVVDSIECHNKTVAEALPGDAIGFVLRGLSHREIRRGHVASDIKLDPARVTVEFTAQMIILNAAGEIRRGYSPIVHCHAAMVACRIKEITQKIDRLTGKVVEQNPERVKTGDACMVVLEPLRPMTVEVFQHYPSLGRIAMRDTGRTIAVGVIKAVKKAETRIAKPPAAEATKAETETAQALQTEATAAAGP